MGVNTKVIKRRIKSVANTKKITKAMELVAASKMRKAVASVLASRPYAQMAWEMVDELREVEVNEKTHPLVQERTEVKRTLAILVTSHRGLCGGFNAQVMKMAAKLRDTREGTLDLVAIGKRGEGWSSRNGIPVVATFPGLAEEPSAGAVRPLAKMATEGFLDGTWDEVILVYTDFISAIAQQARQKTLLPLRRDSELGDVGQSKETEGAEPKLGHDQYLFEPDPQTVLDRLLPRIVETQLYQAMLESSASEHSARMLAMRSATDNANDMLDELKFTFNQARQASITQEIAEIAAGAAALGG